MGLAVDDYMIPSSQLDPFDGDLPAFVDMSTANDIRVRDIYCLAIGLYDSACYGATSSAAVEIPKDKRCVGSLVVGYLKSDITRVSTPAGNSSVQSKPFCKSLIEIGFMRLLD